jgi:hypothetical protein
VKIFSSLVFWSALSGFVGTVLMFFYGLPEPIHRDGSIYLALEQIDVDQIRTGVIYTLYSYLGLGLVSLSFLLQFLDSLKQFKSRKNIAQQQSSIDEGVSGSKAEPARDASIK